MRPPLTLITLAAFSSLAPANADQLLYNARTGQQTILLRDNGTLWDTTDGTRIGQVQTDSIYNTANPPKLIGYRQDQVLFYNNGRVLAYSLTR